MVTQGLPTIVRAHASSVMRRGGPLDGVTIRVFEVGPIGSGLAKLRVGCDETRNAFSESRANRASDVGGMVGRLLLCPILISNYTVCQGWTLGVPGCFHRVMPYVGGAWR